MALNQTASEFQNYVVEVLLEKHPNLVSYADTNLQTPLHYAAKFCPHLIQNVLAR